MSHNLFVPSCSASIELQHNKGAVVPLLIECRHSANFSILFKLYVIAVSRPRARVVSWEVRRDESALPETSIGYSCAKKLKSTTGGASKVPSSNSIDRRKCAMAEWCKLDIACFSGSFGEFSDKYIRKNPGA